VVRGRAQGRVRLIPEKAMCRSDATVIQPATESAQLKKEHKVYQTQRPWAKRAMRERNNNVCLARCGDVTGIRVNDLECRNHTLVNHDCLRGYKT